MPGEYSPACGYFRAGWLVGMNLIHTRAEIPHIAIAELAIAPCTARLCDSMIERSLSRSVLLWYRKCLRSARTWPGPNEEKLYIKDEARRGFRESRGLQDAAEVQRKVSASLSW